MKAYYDDTWKQLEPQILGRWVPSFTGATNLTVVDTSLLGNDLQIRGTTQNDVWTVNDSKTALTMDGVDDSALGSFVELNYPFTVSFWVQSNSAQNMYVVNITNTAASNMIIHGIVFNGAAWVQNLRVFSNSSQIFSLESGNYGVTFPSTWSLYTAVWESATRRTTYLNASQALTNTSSVSIPFVNRIDIGGFTANSSRRLRGSIDDVIIWGTALSSSQVELIYRSGRGGGIQLETPRVRSRFAQITTFKNYWFRNQQRMIGGGVR